MRTGLAHYDKDFLSMHDLDLSSPGKPAEIQAYMHPDDVPAMVDEIARALADPARVSGHYRLRTRTRGERTFVIAADPVNEEGNVVGVAGYAIDTTEDTRRVANEAVQASAEHRACIEQIKGGLMAAHAVDSSVAFELLRRISMDANVRVAELAAGVVRRLSDPQDRFHQAPGEQTLLQLIGETAVGLGRS